MSKTRALVLRSQVCSAMEAPEVFENLLRTVIAGGSIVDFPTKQGIDYADMMLWIRADPDRQALYEQALEDRKEWGKESVFKSLRAIGLMKLTDVFNDDGTAKPLSEWGDDLGVSLKDLEGAFTREMCPECGHRFPIRITKMKFHDKPKALELIGKHASMFVEKVQHEHTFTLEDMVRESMQAKVVDEPVDAEFDLSEGENGNASEEES